MTWSLNANGHLQNADAENELVRDLRKVLVRYGAQASTFGGTFAGRIEGLHIKDKDETGDRRDDSGNADDVTEEDGRGEESTSRTGRGRSRTQAKDGKGDLEGPADGDKALGVSRSAAPGAK